MINIKNTQRKIALDKTVLSKSVQQILAALRYADFDIGIWVTTDATIRRYNREFRHKDKPTDILSFPYHPHLEAGKRVKVTSDEDKNLGDLIISAEFVRRDAQRYEQTFEQRMNVLLVHGVCHLLGYDHLADDDYRRMHAKELWLLKKI